jgi:hypothetical protein
MPLKKPIVPYLNLSDSAGPSLEGLRCSGCNAVFIDTREACSKCYARGALVPFQLANVDGAAAVVLASEKKAKQLGLMSRAVRIRASILTSDPYSERDLVMHDFNACTKLAARQAYEAAQLGPKDLDLVELHDCFATAEIVHYENLGARQVKNARIGLTHVVGIGSAASIHILEKA